ncbi:MAG: hydrolase [Leucobacter sp.]
MTVRANYLDAAGRLHRGTLRVDANGRIRLDPTVSSEDGAGPELGAGVVTGAFTDWHVHLQLIDPAALTGGALGRVVDLGGDPVTLEALSRRPPAGLAVDFAGAFLTPPGGYPSDRSWAPAGSFIEIRGPHEAAAAVAALAARGASCVKVASNLDAGPVFTDALFRGIVTAAAAVGLPVVAHAEGPGEALRAHRLGARIFAHAPFSERLDDTALAELAAGSTWISTLDIHGWGDYGTDYETALDNLARFHLLGGRVRYGTDMGNGSVPLGLSVRELAALAAAGLGPLEQLEALTPADPLDPGTRLLLVPCEDPNDPDTLDPAAARPLTPADLHR